MSDIPSIISGTITGSVIEAGGASNATPGTPAVTGTLTAADADGPANSFTAVSSATATAGGYGTYTITSGGVWTYTLNNGNAAVQALNVGDTLTDTFTVTTADGTAQVVTTTINGANDAATFTANGFVSTTEAGGVNNAIAGTPTAGDTIAGSDVDSPFTPFVVVSAPTASLQGYGTFTVAADGAFAYTVDNANPTVQALNAGALLFDTFVMHSADGTAVQITAVINGANDAAVISGTSSGSVVEASGANNAVAGTPTASGTLTAADPDNVANSFTAVSSAMATAGGYGTYTVTSGGAWTYTLNNGNAAVQALNVGDTLTDTFTVTTADGTAQVVTATINGANDAATFTANGFVSTTEAGGVNNAIAGTPTAGDTIAGSDVDSLFTPFAVSAPTAGQQGYGTFTVAADGAFTYAVDNANPTVQALNAGALLFDTFVMHSADGTAVQITAVINGANDAAVISGTSSGSVVEAGGANNAVAGTPTASGTLTAADPDNAANSFTAVSSATATAGGYGTYTITSGGVWTYTLNNANPSVEALNDGQTLTDSFTVQSADGTAQVVSVVVNGATDQDATPPTVTIALANASLHAGQTSLVTFTFSEDPGAGFTAANVSVLGGALGAVSGTGLVRTALFTPTAATNGGVASVSVAAGAYADAAGNGGEAGAPATLTFDTQPPPAPAAPALAPGSDSGASATDNITDVLTPTLTGAAEAGSTVILYDTDGSTVLGTGLATGGVWSITASTLSGGPHTLTARATDAAGNVSGAGAGLTVQIHTANTAPTGVVAIGGTATQGQTLTAADTLADGDGLGMVSYQWKADGVDIAGATGSSLTLGQAQVGQPITVTASYIDGFGTAESVTSAATGAVANVNDDPTGAVAIAGVLREGQVLTASNTVADIDGLGVISYQWQRNGADIGGASASTYTLTAADAGQPIRVIARYTDSQGATESVASSPTAAVSSADLTADTDLNTPTTVAAAPGAVVTLSGDLSGTAPLTVNGGGTVVMSGTNTYAGPITIGGGTLSVNGSSANSPMTVQSGGTLGGSGTTGAVSIQSGGALAPGNSPGVLHTADLALAAGAAFNVEVASAASYDQVDVTGTVNLGGAALNLTALGGFTPAAGQTYVIVNNDGVDAVTGAFAGLAQGDTVTVGGAALKISYVGGSGNDVTLAIAGPPVVVPPGAGTGSGPTISPLASTSAALGFDAGSAKALAPVVALADGSSIANPTYVTALKAAAVQAQFASGQLSAIQAKAALVDLAFATKGVAVETYSFFTGAPPTADGLRYLIDSPVNPTDLTDAYYAPFNPTNRYINFAVNLGASGEGREAFQASYGALSFEQAVAKAYDAVIGDGVARAAGHDPAASEAYVVSQRPYFQALAGSDLGAKAAMVGYLLGVGVDAHLGAYYDAAHGLIQGQVQLVGVSGGPA